MYILGFKKFDVARIERKSRGNFALCCSWPIRLELLRQAQEKDGNSGH